jgi:hypothetical protein
MCGTLDEEAHLSEVMLLTTILGVVSATARILYQHPIQWSEEADDELGSSARTKMQNLFKACRGGGVRLGRDHPSV